MYVHTKLTNYKNLDAVFDECIHANVSLLERRCIVGKEGRAEANNERGTPHLSDALLFLLIHLFLHRARRNEAAESTIEHQRPRSFSRTALSLLLRPESRLRGRELPKGPPAILLSQMQKAARQKKKRNVQEGQSCRKLLPFQLPRGRHLHALVLMCK